ncbi:MAG: amidohydrolase family protein [Bacteroidetes bacterium]|nr:amidohydrolase family protein [Bacteroidota bacterium]
MDYHMIDTHVHLWDVDRLDYPWLNGLPALNRSYVLDDFDEDTRGYEVKGFVFIECTGAMDDRISQDELEWITELANRDKRIRGIVAHASLEKGEAVHGLLTWLAERPLVKGVRRLLQGEPDVEFCLRPGFVEGVQKLAEFGLTFDACIYHFQLESLIRLVDRCPRVLFVLDHIGKPAIRDGQLDPWREHIRALASLPNVVCKISGVLAEADHDTWTIEQVMPYLEHAVEAFGPDRIMFGGDWPVLRLAGTYSEWMELVIRLAHNLSEPDRDKLFSSNAERVYRLTA